MPVTILYQGNPLTFPNLDSPDEAYKQLGEAPAAPAQADGASDNAPVQLDASKEKSGIDPELLKQNKSWIQASKVLYNATQGHNWDEKNGDASLAEWGLDRMSRFNNNLPLMGVDAVNIKNAPTDQKKAFLYLLDTYDKTNYTMSGFERAAKWAALDPTNYVGLSTFGLGAAAGEGAKLTTLAGVRQALKHGLTGAIEGGLIGGARSRIEEEARVNAGGQDSVDYGNVALNTAAGAGLGAVLAPLVNGIKGHFTPGKAAEAEAPKLMPEASSAPEVQGELPLGDMSSPGAAVQTRLDRVEPGMPEAATQQTLPGFAQNDLSKPGAFEDLPLQRNLDKLPDQLQPSGPGPGIDEQADRLMKDWGISHQADMFPNHPEDRRLPASASDGTIKLESSTAQGDLFAHLPEQTRNAIDDTVTKAAETGEQMSGPSITKKATTALDNLPKPSADEKIGGANGPTISDLKAVLQNVGSKIDTDAVKGWKAITDVSSPLARALVHLSADDATKIVKEFAASSMTQGEFKGFVNSAINAQNTVAQYIDSQLRLRNAASNPAMKAQIENKIATASKVFEPLKAIAKEAGSTSGNTLAANNNSLFSGAAQRELSLDKILKEQGLDTVLATDAQKADAYEKWFSGIVDRSEKTQNNQNILQLRQQIADAPADANQLPLWEKLAQAREEARQKDMGDITRAGAIGESLKKIMLDTGSFLAHTVLTPSSLTVNTVSNAMMVFSRPALDFITKADHVAFRQMTASYGGMYRVATSALMQAKLAFELEHSLLTGTESKWIENRIKPLEQETGQSNVTRFLGRNGVRIWTRLLNATDEFFQVVSYHGFVEGDAAAKAMLAAKNQGLDREATNALVKDYVQRKLSDAYTKNPDSSTIGMLRDAGIKQGYTGDNLKLFVQNQLDSNPKYLRRATNEEGVSYTNDLLFKREFSGDNAASSAAQMYEKFVQEYPIMRIMGQLFFRTPVRVFEAGMRMVPGVQLVVPKFWDDLAGRNGFTRQVRARGELMLANGFTSSVMTGYATGSITGSGGDLSPMERRKLEDSGWRPYSIKVGDKYVNYRNYDPISTPVKIIVNAMERLQHLQVRQAQGELDSKTSLEQITAYVGLASASVLGAIKDANLTSGIDDWVKLGTALADPERKENAFQQFAQSKAQLAIPNAIRRGVRFFGDGQNVSNDAANTDQVMEAIINPASDKVTHQYDALGFPRTIQQQGLFPFIGIDAAGKEARQRGLSDRDANSLNEIAKMTYATGKTFNPSSKYGNIDLKQEMSQDGRATLFNKAMAEYNANMPKAAADFFEKFQGLPVGRRGSGLSPRGEAFSQLQNGMWRQAIHTVGQNEPKISQALQDQLTSKIDVLQGNREVGNSFQ